MQIYFKKIQCMCFPVSIVKILSTAFLQVTSGPLFLRIGNGFHQIHKLCHFIAKNCVTSLHFKLYHIRFSFSLQSSPEAVTQRCSIKKVFLDILQISQENTCARDSFLIKLQFTSDGCFCISTQIWL